MSPAKSAPARRRAAKPKAAPPAPAKPSGPTARHQLVPAHELLSPEEGVKVLADLGAPVERLPKILLDDAGLRTDPKFSEHVEKDGLTGLVGRLVRIHRPSPTAGSSVAYRVIVASAEE